jgi:hypothetical protein
MPQAGTSVADERHRRTESREAARRRALSEAAAPERDPVTGRRTVTITGRGAERSMPPTQRGTARRNPRPRHERSGFRADRAAMWAVILGLVMVLVAATSSHAAVIAHSVALLATHH